MASSQWIKVFYGVVLLLQIPVIVSGFYIELPLDSINTTVRYNSITGTYDVGPNDSFSIGCTYSNVPVNVASAEVRWAVYSSPSALRKSTLFTNDQVKDDTVLNVFPREVPRNKQVPLASGTMWLTVSHANMELYTQDNPALTYQCEIVAINSTSLSTAVQLHYTKNITISIVEPAKNMTVVATPPNWEIAEGDNVTLQCMAAGFPRPTIFWSRTGGKALVGSNTGCLRYKGRDLHLWNVTKAAEATFICSATNRVTNVTITQSIDIRIFQLAEIVDIVGTPPVDRIVEGDNVTLECLAEGNPRPTITWFREDGKALVGSRDGGLQYTGSTLELWEISSASAASYVCSAKNNVTKVAPTKAVSVEVFRPAKILYVYAMVTSPRDKITEGDNIKLVCVVTGDPRPTITWSREDGKALVGSRDGGLQYTGGNMELWNVTEATTASYTCSATNKVTDVPPTNTSRLNVYGYC